MPPEDTAEQSLSATLRPVVPADESFLLKVYASVRAQELAQVPWSLEQKEAFIRMQFEAQQQHYQAQNPNVTHDIILLGEQPAGRLYVSRREQEIRILDITILPEYRSHGLGTPLIQNLMNEAADDGKALTIYVECFNPSLRLFERLGFEKVEEDGINYLMQWRRQASTPDRKDEG